MLKAIDSVEFNLKTVLLTDVDVEMVQLWETGVFLQIKASGY